MGYYVPNSSEEIPQVVKKIYLFSGMGADSRLFKNLGPIEGYEIIPLPYIHPQQSKTLGDYAALLADHYTFEEPYLLGGVSMGGMIAQELAQLTNPEELVLISTATSRTEMPLLFEWARQMRLASLFNKPALEAIAKLGDQFTVKSPEGRQLFLDMLHDSDPDFMKFGAKSILEWEPAENNLPTVRIHGTIDRVFPASKITDATMIEGGNHFMIFERGEEITKILSKKLDTVLTK
ncbi:MAG: pimeloyl-ACP methyl ester carboxylesterase [Cryomorphaceae bacterium]